MRQSVRDGFVPFTAPLEGVCHHMYLDVKGLVTTAIGNLIDPVGMALPLPWTVKGQDVRASRAEVLAEWQRVKSMQDKRMYGGNHKVFRDSAQLVLTDIGIKQVVMGKLDEMDRYLAARFPAYPEWPADAQLATLSMSWACGPAFDFPRLVGALRQQNFLLAVDHCHISEAGNPGIVPRNEANKLAYSNAALVRAVGMDPEVLHYPQKVVPSEVIQIQHSDYVASNEGNGEPEE